MRLWSLHPKYLDPQGLVALWRESLLARKVLEGKTKGYRAHPQLQRFSKQANPLAYINNYLLGVLEESQKRNYNFDKGKVSAIKKLPLLEVTQGQMEYERGHLLKKLEVRSPGLFRSHKETGIFVPHPVFEVVAGSVEAWEVEPKKGV